MPKMIHFKISIQDELDQGVAVFGEGGKLDQIVKGYPKLSNLLSKHAFKVSYKSISKWQFPVSVRTNDGECYTISKIDYVVDEEKAKYNKIKAEQNRRHREIKQEKMKLIKTQLHEKYPTLNKQLEVEIKSYYRKVYRLDKGIMTIKPSWRIDKHGSSHLNYCIDWDKGENNNIFRNLSKLTIKKLQEVLIKNNVNHKLAKKAILIQRLMEL